MLGNSITFTAAKTVIDLVSKVDKTITKLKQCNSELQALQLIINAGNLTRAQLEAFAQEHPTVLNAQVCRAAPDALRPS